MSDFCRQCSEETFGKDFGDMKNVGGKDAVKLEPGYGWRVCCESCGVIRVDSEGRCISTRADGCFKDHGGTCSTGV